MTEREFLQRRRTVRLMKQITEMRREREARQAKAETFQLDRSDEWREEIRNLMELAAKLKGSRPQQPEAKEGSDPSA